MEKEQILNGEIIEIVTDIDAQCKELNMLLVNQIKLKDALIDRLHDELDYYKKEEAEQFENQLVKSVIKIRQSLRRKVISEDINSFDAERLYRELTYVYEDLTDLLDQQNCDEISSLSGTIFDPSIHMAKVELTDDASLDKTIKNSISAGYKRNGKTIIPERVIVYQLKR